MAYTKTNWVDGFTPLSAENMNNIENGILNIENGILNIENSLSNYIKTIDVINNINPNGSGSLILPNKFMLQFGTVNYDSSNEGWQKGYAIGYFDKKFANINYKVIATSCYFNGAIDMLPTVQNRDGKSFNVYIRNLNKEIPMVAVNINYIAIGVSP